LLRASHQLWDPLEKTTKDNIIAALKKSGEITRYQNNWVMLGLQPTDEFRQGKDEDWTSKKYGAERIQPMIIW